MSSENVSEVEAVVTNSSEFTWDELMTEFAPKEKTCTVELRGGKIIEVKIPYDGGEMYSLEKGASDFVMVCNTSSPPAWAAYLPQASAVLKMVYKLSKLIVKPVMSQQEGLRLAKENGALLAYMYGKVMQASAHSIADTEVAVLEDLGEN